MPAGNVYTDEYMLDRLHKHLVDERGSIYCLFKPTWQCYLKRMKKDAEFEGKVKDCQAEGFNAWWHWGMSNIDGSNPDFNTGLFKFYTQNKAPFIDHKTAELEERIINLETSKR